jgi:hypothetical protein
MSARRAGVVALTAAFGVLAALAGPVAAGESKSDNAILKAGVLTKSDVPAGWKSTKSTRDNDSTKGIAECNKIRSSITSADKKVPHSDSRDFEDPGRNAGTAAENTVYAFKDATAAGKFLANFAAETAAECLRKSLARGAKEVETAGVARIAPITDLEGVGEEAVGYEMTINFAADNPTTAYIDFLAIRVGRAFLGFNFVNLGEPFSDGPTMVQTVLTRVAEAQTST